MSARRGADDDPLATYRRKRDFARTPEPGSRGARRARTRDTVFVVQRHDARRLHYDFRLEWGGVLKSWAVPRGPSLDPAAKRLAVQTEDHPLEYADFAGDIPAGEYGGGHVDVWDRGTWTPESDPEKAWAAGRLTFELRGRRLHGRWHLVRTRADTRGPPQWLLIKSHDAHAVAGHDAETSSSTHAAKTDAPEVRARVADARGGARKSASAKPAPAARKRARKSGASSARERTRGRGASVPDFVAPQLATLTDAAPRGVRWLHEIKLDGYRLLAHLEDDVVRICTRNAQDWTARFPALRAALAALGRRGTWLDGELVAPDERGHASFQALQRRLGTADEATLQYYVFDAPFVDGEDLRSRPLHERRARLERVLHGHTADGPLRYSRAVAGHVAELWRESCALGFEGLILKDPDAPYTAGRGGSWLKLKCRTEQEFVVGGYAVLANGRPDVSNLVLGYYEAERLRFAAKVGTGFGLAEARDLKRRFAPAVRTDSPFAERVPVRSHERITWLQPRFVAQVAFAGWTGDDHVRAPVFLGLREDKEPTAVRRERAVSTAAKRAAPATLTHPDRIVYPTDGVTKRELADYYAAAATRLLPHLAGRPLSLVRATGQRSAFFQKHYAGTPPPGLELTCIDLGTGAKNYVVCRDASGLASLAQLATVELHCWGSLAKDPLHADRLTLDLDPDPKLSWRTVADAALVLRALLRDLGLESWCKTTGGQGLHVVVPLGGARPDWPTAKSCARAVATFLARELPSRFVAQTGAERRVDRIFVDYLRNGAGATAVAAYSPRQRPGVPVSVPIAWADVERDTDVRGAWFALRDFGQWNRGRRDPWDAYWRCRQELDAAQFERLTVRPRAADAQSPTRISAGGRAGKRSRARAAAPRRAARSARRSG